MKISLADRIRAAQGPPAYMVRLRRIEDMETAFLRELRLVYGQALAQLGDPKKAEERLVYRARLFDLTKLNDLIEKHNLYYPVEANLPSDVRSLAIMDGQEPWRPRPKWTVEELVKQAARTA